MSLINNVCSSMPKLVMFDLDGTLVDSVPDLASAVDMMLDRLGRPVAGIDNVSQWVGNGAEMLVRRALSGSMNPGSLDEETFRQAHHAFLDAYRELSGSQSILYPGVMETLINLRERVEFIAVVTNKPEQFTQPLLDHLKLPAFDLLVCGDTLATKKPDPAPLHYCMERFACLASESLMVGDSVSDIKAAQAANVPVICVSYGYHQGEDLRQYSPDAYIDSFDALKM